ncbi:hypothetical protein [Burkholderia gladioli]|uniref:hypothetical protein n=1 Tax=Burkholderia gladioli TaxID=28095 RepID=UPI003132C5D6
MLRFRSTAPSHRMAIRSELHPPLDLKPDTVLYRGVNRAIHDDGRGLRPRDTNKPFERHVFFDGTWKCDGSVTFGTPHGQAVHAHQWDSEGFNGPALSFTTIEKVARRFATTDGLEDGVVYAVTVAELEAAGCRLDDPRIHTSGLQNPEEHEVIVVPLAGDGLSIDRVRVTEVMA